MSPDHGVQQYRLGPPAVCNEAPRQRLRFPGLRWYLAQGPPGAAESVDPSRAPTLSVARSWYAVLRLYDEFPIPSCLVRIRIPTL